MAEELAWHSREAKFDLQLHSEEDHLGRLSLAFDYAAELFEASTVERLAHHLLALLEQVCAAPQQALGDVQLLDEPGRAQLLGWGQAPAAAAQHLLVEQLNEQARLTPQRTALVWDGAAWITPGCTSKPTAWPTTCVTKASAPIPVWPLLSSAHRNCWSAC